MKRLILSTFLFCFFISLNTNAVFAEKAQSQDEARAIELFKRKTPIVTRAPFVFPVNLFQRDMELNIFFLSNIGTVSISICDSSGAVIYQDLIDTSVLSQINIDTSLYNNESYTISFLYGGTNIYGYFQI